MSLSDRLRSLLNKKASSSGGKEKEEVRPTPSPVERPDLARQLEQKKSEGRARSKALDQEILNIRTALEKTELQAKNSQETHQQSLQFLQQDAEREIQF